MGSGWTAFWVGLRRSLQYPQIVILLWLVSLISAGVLGLFPSLSLLEPAHRPAFRDAADGLEAWMIIETMISPVNRLPPVQGEVQLETGVEELLLGWVLAALLVPLAAGIPAAFLYGGVLHTYLEAPEPFRWGSFIRAGWRWWGPFLFLGGLEAVAILLLLLFLGALAAMAVVAGLPWLVWPLGMVLILGSAFILFLAELTRTAGIARGRRNIFYALGQGLRLIARRPAVLLLFLVFAVLLLVLIHLVFRVGLLPRLPLALGPLVLAALQGFVLFRIIARIARLAGEAHLVQEILREKTMEANQV